MAEGKVRKGLKWLANVIALGLVATGARGNLIDLGVLSYHPFIPGSPASPGVDAFDTANFTKAFNLPQEFPVTDS
jgi:hypothetical protein